MSQFPKLLVINGTPIGQANGTGITLQNLFSNWPQAQLLQLCYVGPGAAIALDSHAPEYVPFPPQTAYVDHLFRRAVARLRPANGAPARTSGLNANIRRQSFAGSLHDFGRAVLDCSPLRFSPALLKRVDGYQPEVIYSNLASLRMMQTVLFFARRYDIHITAHFMDDWPSTIYTTSVLSRWANRFVDRQIRACLARSKRSIGISQWMAEVYEQRYGIGFTWAADPVDITESSSEPLQTDEMIFTYSGGLHLNRWQSLEVVAEALEDLRQQGQRVVLRIYTNDDHRRAFEPQMKALPVVQWMGSVGPQQVPEMLRQAGVLVHVESFDPDIVDFTRYSFSTKLSQYMANGRPILAYAPADLASTRYLIDHEAGLAADQPAALREHVQRLVTQPGLRAALAARGLECARRDHEKSVTQQRVMDAIVLNSRRERG